MTQYNIGNIKLSQLNKLKSATKNETGVTLRASSKWLIILVMKLIFHVDFTNW